MPASCAYLRSLPRARVPHFTDASMRRSTKREFYLSANEFASVMGMPKPEFYAMPAWKQAKMKKDKQLF